MRRLRPLVVCEHLRIAALFLFVLGTNLFSQDAPPPQPSPKKIQGTVINSVTKEPIQRALVYTSDSRFATLTDDHGHFEFNFVVSPSGDAAAYFENTLSSRRPGYFESSTQATGEDITIALVPEASIIGRISVPNVSDIDRMTISVYRRQVTEGRSRWTRLNDVLVRSNGDFRVTNLAAGTYKIFTNEALDRDPLTFDPNGPFYGYPPIYFPAATNFATAATIELTPGQTFQVTLSPTRQAYYPVNIPVVQSGEEGQVDVVVSQGGQRGPGFTLGYDAQQHAIIGSLPNGNYTVEAVTGNVTPQSGAVHISVRDAPLAGPALTLVPVNFVSLNIDDQRTTPPSEGRAVVRRGRSVQLQSVAGSSLVPVEDFGLATPIPFDYTRSGFPAARPGRYWLRLNASNGYVASARSGNVDLLREPLTVGMGGSLPPIEVILRDDLAQLEGTVEGLQKKPASQLVPRRSGLYSGVLGVSAYIYCLPLPDESGQFHQIFAQQDGTFADQQMPPGSYRVLAFDREQPELDWRNSEAMRAYESKGQVIHLAPGQKEHLRLQLITTEQ